MEEDELEDMEAEFNPIVDGYWHVNALGVQEIRDFIRMHHKKGKAMFNDEEIIQSYAMMVELNLLDGKGQFFDIEAFDEITDTNIECWLQEESISVRLTN